MQIAADVTDGALFAARRTELTVLLLPVFNAEATDQGVAPGAHALHGITNEALTDLTDNFFHFVLLGDRFAFAVEIPIVLWCEH